MFLPLAMGPLISKVASVLIILCLFQNCYTQSREYNFVVFNDIKGQLQNYNRGTEVTKPVPCSGTDCRGGFRKIMEQINHFRNYSTFVITPGNLVGGESGWLQALGWFEYGLLVREFYRPHVTTLGMYDFMAGLSSTMEYMSAAGTPFVLSNVICKGAIEPTELTFCNHELLTYDKVYPLTETIGVVGFVNPDVMKLSSPGGLQFAEVIPTLQNVIASSPKYDTYIAIGDGSWELANDILAQIPEVQLVIYGQGFGSSRNMTGNFPEVTENGIIATGGNFGSAVGKLLLEINSAGAIVNTSGSELVSTDLVAVSSDAAAAYNQLAARVQINTNLIASSHFDLNGEEACWREECNLGNVITDGMVHCVLSNLNENTSLPTQEPLFAIWHSNARFLDSFDADRTITTLDTYKWLPYNNQLYLVSILGSDLLEVLKKGASGITAHLGGTEKDWGQFLQVSSGMRVAYMNSGESVEAQVQLLHRENTTTGNKVFAMKDLDPDHEYYFVLPSFIYEGRNVYAFLKSYWQLAEPLDLDDTTCLAKYVEAMTRLAISTGERINGDEFKIPTTTTPSSSSNAPLPLPSVFTKPVAGNGETVLGNFKVNLPVALVVIIVASQRLSKIALI